MRTPGGLSILLLVAGCASSRSPLELRVDLARLRLEPGREARVEARLVNTGSKPVRIHEDSTLNYMLTCRLPGDAPGEPSVGYGTGPSGIVWGGVADGTPDPGDPLYCKRYPPESIELAAGGARPYAVVVTVPARCIEGDGELEIGFHAPDDGRRCAGMWFGDVGPKTRDVPIRHAIAGGRAAPRGSPAAIVCHLSPDPEPGAASFEIALRNPGRAAWRASGIPALEAVTETADGEQSFWAPLRLTQPAAALPDGEAERVEVAAGGDLRRLARLDELAWGESSGPWPAMTFSELPPGRYRLTLSMEILGGRSWKFGCDTATFEISAP
jgi:hypothetical protein